MFGIRPSKTVKSTYQIASKHKLTLFCNSNSISLTKAISLPWWKLSFKAPYFISYIEIYNREDDNEKRIEGLQVCFR